MSVNSNTKLVLKYLKDNECIESFLTLERQSGVSLTSYSKEIQFFKKIILKGDFSQAVAFLLTFENRIEQEQFKTIMLDLYRQKLCELIQNPNQQQLKKLFQRELISYCAQEEFQELFGYLTFRSVNEIQGFQKWTVMRGRYQCFQTIVPFLDMFNSTMKSDQTEDKLEEVIDFYHKNKFNQSQPFSFNKNTPRLDQQQMQQTLGKNKSSLQQNFNRSNNVYNSFGEKIEEKITVRNQNKDQQKQIIKNSVINMNISGNYTQMKSKLIKPGTIQKKASRNQEDIQQKIQSKKSNYVEKPAQIIQKSQYLGQKNSQLLDKNIKNSSKIQANIQKSQINEKKIGNSSLLQKSEIANEKRPRTNANLKGTTQKQRIQGSIKIDNFMRNESTVSVEENVNLSSAYKNPKIQKLQPFNNNSSTYSQLNKSSKVENKPNYTKVQDNPIVYSHLNDYDSSQLNEITEEDNSQAAKSVKNQKQKYSYLHQKDEDQDLSQQIKKNVEYLQQSNSVIWNKSSRLQNLNFALGQEEEESIQKVKIKNITKLGTTSDSKAIRTCQFSQSGNYFAVGTNSSILKIFDVQNLFLKNKFQEIAPVYQIDGIHLKSIFCLDWSKNQRNLVTCSNDLNVKITEINKNFTQHKTSVIGKHESCIRMARFSPSESRILSCGDDSLIKVWDMGKAKKCLNLKSHTSSVSAFKIQNQNELYSVSKDMTIKKWDIRTGDNVFTSKIQESQLTYIANNTQKIVVSHKNGCVSFFTPSLELIHAVQIHEQEIRSVQALRGGNLLLTASFDGHVAFFSENSNHQPYFWQHNESGDDKVVFATFLHSNHFRGFSSTSTQGLCHVYSYE